VLSIDCHTDDRALQLESLLAFKHLQRKLCQLTFRQSEQQCTAARQCPNRDGYGDVIWLRRLIDRTIRGSPHLNAGTVPKCRNDSSRRCQTTWTSTNDGNVHGFLSGGFKHSHADYFPQSSQLLPRLAAFAEFVYATGFMRVYAKIFALRRHLDLLRLDQSLKKPIKKLSETGLVKRHP